VSTLKDLYREAILKHAAKPAGYRRPVAATHRCEGHNPFCGDRVEIMVQLAGDVVQDVGFDGEACSICLASASLLCEQVRGVSVDDLLELKARLEHALGGSEEDEIGALSPLLGVRPYPSRIQCALLPWQTAERALHPGDRGPGETR